MQHLFSISQVVDDMLVPGAMVITLSVCANPELSPVSATWGIPPFFAERAPLAPHAAAIASISAISWVVQNMSVRADPELSPAAATWGIPPFFVERGPLPPHAAAGNAFNFQAPTTSRNAMRVLRALQVRKSILLEGSPGVGKTALVSALAKAAGDHSLTLCSSWRLLAASQAACQSK